MGINGEEQVCS